MKTNAELMEENAWFIELIREGGECLMWLYDRGKDYPDRREATGFNIEEGVFYYLHEDVAYPHADSIKTERRYLGRVEQMQWLVDHGYDADEDGTFFGDTGSEPYFIPEMWRNCGRIVGHGFNESRYLYHPEWIKEVEV